MYKNIHALLSKVMWGWKIATNNNKKEVIKNRRGTSHYSESAQIQHSQLQEKAEKLCVVWAISPVLSGLRTYVPDLSVHCSRANPPGAQGRWAAAVGHPSTLLVPTSSSSRVSSSCASTASAISAWWPLPSTPLYLQASCAATPVSEGTHRAVHSFRMLTDGLGRQQKENVRDLAFFFFP